MEVTKPIKGMGKKKNKQKKTPIDTDVWSKLLQEKLLTLPKYLEFNIKDFLYHTPAPVLSYSCWTKLERHMEGVKENNRIQSEKLIFNMFNKAKPPPWGLGKWLPVIEPVLLSLHCFCLGSQKWKKNLVLNTEGHCLGSYYYNFET